MPTGHLHGGATGQPLFPSSSWEGLGQCRRVGQWQPLRPPQPSPWTLMASCPAAYQTKPARASCPASVPTPPSRPAPHCHLPHGPLGPSTQPKVTASGSSEASSPTDACPGPRLAASEPSAQWMRVGAHARPAAPWPVRLSLCLQENSRSASTVWTVPWGPSPGATTAAASPGQSECRGGLQGSPAQRGRRVCRGCWVAEG